MKSIDSKAIFSSRFSFKPAVARFKRLASVGLIGFFAQSALSETPYSYAEWAQTWFPGGGADAAHIADPDADNVSNISEFAFGLEPNSANSARLFDVTLGGGAGRTMTLSYSLRAVTSQLLVLPQSTEDLASGQWRGDHFTITSVYGPDAGKITVTAIDSTSGVPKQRFARILVALDSDSDGMSDDWELAHGFLPFDDADRIGDIDGDGDLNWIEFLQGTDPRDRLSSSALFRIPRAPRDVTIGGVLTLFVRWDDVADNEAEFRIYDAVGALIGTAPANARHFQLPTTFSYGESVSVSAANESGESPATTSATAPGSGDPGEPIDGDSEFVDIAHAMVSAPMIEITRKDGQTVKVSWRCAPVNLPNKNKKLRLFRQKQDTEWENIFEVALPGNEVGSYDDGAPAGVTYRYSAAIVMDGIFGLQGSDAASPMVDDYVESLYAMRVNRGYELSLDMTAPGNNMAPDVLRDHHFLKALRAGTTPSFVPASPAVTQEHFTTTIDANQGWRFFTPGLGGHTVLGFNGFVVRGRPFTIGARAIISPQEPTLGVTLRLDTQPSRTSSPSPSARAGTNEWVLPDFEIENPTVRVTGDESAGFDAVTFFASQTMRAGGDNNSKRTVFFTPTVPTNTAFIYSNSGPFTFEPITTQEVLLTSVPSQTESGEGLLNLPLGDAEGRNVKVQVLPPKGRSVDLRKVIFLDDSDSSNITTYEGPEPPVTAQLESWLNGIFLAQAGVHIAVTRGPDIVILASELPLPFSPITQKPIFKPSFPGLPGVLWAHAMSSSSSSSHLPPFAPDIVLFFVPGLTADTAGIAFGTPSRGALIGPSSAVHSSVKVCAHEIGHCFGLSHVWIDEFAKDVSLAKLPDTGGTRLMGYGRGGLILRYREAKIVNDWKVELIPLP